MVELHQYGIKMGTNEFWAICEYIRSLAYMGLMWCFLSRKWKEDGR
jgi:hypothetical protein